MQRQISNAQMQAELNKHILSSLKEDFPKHYAIYKKVISRNQLPREIECIRLMRKLDGKYGNGAYAGILQQNHYYQIVHDKMIEDLSRLVERLGNKNAIEVCAGKGKISYWLNRKGIEIIPTDIKGKGYVEKMDYLEAIRSYKPDLVVAAWPSPPSSSFVNNVMNQKSVDHLIVLGKGGYYARKYYKSILKHSEIIPINLRTYPSAVDSRINGDENSKEVKKATRKFFQVGRSEQLFQSVLFRTKRN